MTESDDEPTVAYVLRLAMEAYSEEHWCAGWMSGLEHILWREGGGWHEVARLAGGWWEFDRFVPLDEWLGHGAQEGAE